MMKSRKSWSWFGALALAGLALSGAIAGCQAECDADADCASGEVCELSTGCNAPSLCTAGCHDDSQCAAGEVCNIVQCFTCPCPGRCEPKAQEGCTSDTDCQSGEVCEPTTGCNEPFACVPGCHDSSQCPAGSRCEQTIVCITCPCPAQCVSTDTGR